MKKFLFLTLVSAIVGTTSYAQTSSVPTTSTPQPKETMDAATMLQQQKQKIAPAMVEKTGLTLVQAEKVVEILFEMRQGAATVQNRSEEERHAKLAELKATRDSKFSELVTAEQIASVKSFYQEIGKSQRRN